MMQPDDGMPRRRYDSSRRRDRARATRETIAAAARDLFVERGWSGTSVREVARRAGVGEATVYAAYGSKAGLAGALVDAVETEADIPGGVEQALAAVGDDPHAQLAVLVRSDRTLFERGGSLIAMLHDAAHSESDLRSAYDRGRAAASEFQRSVFDRWSRRRLRPGVDADVAADVYSALCSIGVYQVLTQERGWSPDRVEQWWVDSLVRVILSDAEPRPTR